MKVYEVFEAPFKYDDYGQTVTDKNGNIALDIRGWGMFSNLPNGETLQDSFGKWVTECMNKSIKIEGDN